MRAKAADWSNIADLRQTFPNADPLRVASGRTVVVFNIAGNRYRLITAIHYNMRKVFVLRFLTHAEYDRDTWKDEL
jgi:mRNA interferase HigB